MEEESGRNRNVDVEKNDPRQDGQKTGRVTSMGRNSREMAIDGVDNSGKNYVGGSHRPTQ